MKLANQPRNVESRTKSEPHQSNCDAEKHSSEESVIIVDYDGPDDVYNPRNFSIVRKWVITVIIVNGAFCVAGASSIYTRYAHMHIDDYC